jgi:NADH-quinone oxidoreductase subunit E
MIRAIDKFTISRGAAVATQVELCEYVRNAIAGQTQKTITVLSCLLAVQDAVGYVPPVAVAEIAKRMDVSNNDVWAVASFYTNFRFDPPGEHIVEVCWGPSCHIRGAQELLQGVLEVLGLEEEGDTRDGCVTLKYNTCLGACPQAPVMQVDQTLMGGVTPQGAREAVTFLDG